MLVAKKGSTAVVVNKRKLSENGDTPKEDKENPQKNVSSFLI